MQSGAYKFLLDCIHTTNFKFLHRALVLASQLYYVKAKAINVVFR